MKKHIVLILLVLILSVFASCQKSKAIEDEKTKIKIELGVQVGVINDTRVRLRSEPNLQSETLEHLDTGDRLIILDKSAEQEQIDTMIDYWYKVQVEGYPEGWVYGAFVDYEIIWEDPASEEYARNILDKPDGIIMKSDLTGILNKDVAIKDEKNPIDIDLLKNAFSYVGSVDLMTGKHPANWTSPNYLNSIESVKKLTIVQTGEKVNTLTYINGIILTDTDYAIQGNPEGALEYDDNGRLIKASSTTFTYPQELQTDQVIERLYYKNDKHTATKRYRLIEDGFETYYIDEKYEYPAAYYNFAAYNSSVAYYETSLKYIYRDGMLAEIKEKEMQNQRLIELGYVEEVIESTYTFSYENDLIKEIVYENKSNSFGWIQTFTYEGKNIIKIDEQLYGIDIETNDIDFDSSLQTWVFSNYDKYGNWLSCDFSEDNELPSSTMELLSTIKREIEYY